MMRNFNIRTSANLAAGAALLLASTTVAHAHHSFAMYDNARAVELDGVVRAFKWTNPHGQIVLTVTQGGVPIDYAVELSSPNVMARQGWTRLSLKPGERVKVTIHPLKDGSKGGSFMRAVKADGKILGPTAPP